MFINTKSMKNRERAAELNARAEEMIRVYTQKADRISEMVLQQFRKEA